VLLVYCNVSKQSSKFLEFDSILYVFMTVIVVLIHFIQKKIIPLSLHCWFSDG
jgi:hypothetical protein